MSACSYTAPNGQPSILAQQLLDSTQNSDLTDRIMNYIHSDNFEVAHGNWKNSLSNTPNKIKIQGGFESTGKGTPEGDGKDKAMRQVATGIITELAKAPTWINKNGTVRKGMKNGNSSSATSMLAIAYKEKSSETEDYTHNPVIVNRGNSYGLNPRTGKLAIIMLARNKEFSGKPLEQPTKNGINEMARRGATFVVGDMPGVDSQFIDYLKEIGAEFTIYHTGNTSRIKQENADTNTIPLDVNGEPSFAWIKENVLPEAEKQIALKPGLITMDSLIRSKEFQGTPVEFVNEIKSDRDIPKAFQNVNKGEKFLFVKDLFEKKYTEKAWTNSATQKDGSKSIPLKENQFKSFEEFLTFSLLHEKAHEYIFKKDNENTGQYEDRINKEALNKLAALQNPAIDSELAKRIQDKLQSLYPEINLNITNNPIWEQGDNVFNQEEFQNQVQYRLKAVNTLMSDEADKIFRKGDKNGWTLDKILQELQIPKEQQELIKSFNTRNREQILTSLLANYSYTVEINTAKEVIRDQGSFSADDNTFQSDDPDNFGTANSQYYSNLTVPGGTNYTENEISTPLIKPSIKGHAGFSSDNGIGWFRSDDKLNNADLKDKENIYPGNGNPEQEGWEIVDFDEDGPVYKRIDRVTDEKTGTPTKTRRILEVQSDLFQKGRDKEDLIFNPEIRYDIDNDTSVYFKNNKYFFIDRYEEGEYEISYEKASEITKNFTVNSTENKAYKDRNKNNQFLQLLNKNNNWVNFFIKSIIQDSAKKGYEKVLFPTGNTASKVEGHTTLEAFKKHKEDRLKELNEYIKDYENIEIVESGYGTFRVTAKEGYFPSIGSLPTTQDFDTNKEASQEVQSRKNQTQIEITQLKQELERVEKEGFGALKPIYNFYENTVTNILKKQGYNSTVITDEHRNTWNEVTINQARDLSHVLLQRNEANKIIGQANIKAASVLIDAINQKQDTLPHEYAHHYIAWFRDSAIVQEAIKKWGSEEALVQSIGEQVVKQKGEAFDWWNKFSKWLLEKLGLLSELDKETLTKMLTDAFLIRADLSTLNLNQDLNKIKSETEVKEKPTYLTLNESGPKSAKTVEEMKDKIRKEIFEPAIKNPGKTYVLGYNDFSNNYAGKHGYGPRDIASIMDEMSNEIPENLKLPLSFQGAMANSNNRIRMELASRIDAQLSKEFINMDGKPIQEQLERMYIPILNESGESVALFDERDQETAVQTVMGRVYQYALSIDPKTPINKIMNNGLWTMQKYEMAARKEGNLILAEKYRRIVKSFAFEDDRPSFAKMVLRDFKSMRYNLDENVEDEIMKFLAKQKDIYQAPVVDQKLSGQDNPETMADIEEENESLQFENYYSSLDSDGAAGQGVKNWNEVSFEIDQRNTASTRMKMYLSTMAESEFGKYKRAESKEGAIDLSDIEDISELRMDDAIAVNNKSVWHDDPKMLDKIMNSLETVFNVIPFINSLERNQLVQFDSTFEDVLATLASQDEKTIENYVKILRDSGSPNLIAVANSLEGVNPGGKNKAIDEQLRNEFVKVFSKQYNPFLIVWSKTKINSQGKEYSEVKIMNAQRSSQKQTIIKNWKENNKISEMMKVNPATGVRTLDTRKAYDEHLSLVQAYDLFFNRLPSALPANVDGIKSEIKRLLKKIGFIGSFNDFKTDSYGERVWMKKKFQDIFQMYGLEFNDNMIESLFGKTRGNYRVSQETGMGEYDVIDGIEKVTRNEKTHKGSLAKQFSFTQDGRPNGIFSAFFSKAAGVSNINDVDEDSIEEGEEQATLNNPLYTEGPAMKILAGVASKFIPVIHSSTHKTIDGKKVWDFSHNTSLSKAFQKLKSNLEDAVTMYGGVDLISNNGDRMDGSFYLRKWMSDPKIFDKFELFYLEGLKFGGIGSKGTIRANMSDREQLLTSILAYQNGGNDMANMLSLTHSDKMMTPVFANIPKLNTGLTNRDKEVLTEFRELFNGEYRKIAKQANKEFNDSRYDEGKKHFLFLPQFNKEALENRLGEHIQDGNNNIKITQEVIDSLWNADGTISQDITKFERPLMALLNEGIIAREKSALNKFKELGLDSTYMDTNTVNKIKQAWNRLDTELTEKKMEERVMEAIARDYAVNHFLWNTNSSLLFFGDPSLSWKTSVDETMKEYAKRLAKDIAPGQDLAFKPGDKYATITLTDVQTVEDYLERIGIHTKSEATDAQELTTIQEHLEVMFKGGLISKAIYDELLDVIKNKDAKGMYTFNDDQLQVIFSPMKPVYAGFRSPSQGAMLYDYVKSSSYPLLPQFTVDFEIDKLRLLMENYEGADGTKGIQRANFASAKKMGSPAKTATLFNSKGEFTEDINFQAAVQTLSRDGFRIQQDVPVDLEKDMIKVVSQMDGLITQGLPDTMFDIPGKESMSRDELKRFKRDVREKMLNYSVNRLMNQLGSKKVDNKWQPPAIDKLIEILKEEAKSRNYSDNEIDSLIYKTDAGVLEIPPFLHTAAEKFESLLMSIFRKTAINKVPGLSSVQGSSIGYIRTIEKTNLSNVVWVGAFDATTRLKHQREGADEEGNKVILPAQVIVPFNFTYTDKDGNTINADINDYTITAENGRKTLDMDKIPKELLQMIGARIPNQGHNSMMAMEIVGFMPKGLQNLILVPAATLGQMGSDFDVDKLYMYKRSYEFVDGKFNLNKPLTSTTKDVMDLGEDWRFTKEEVVDNLTDQGFVVNDDGTFDDDLFNKELTKVVKARYGKETIPTRKVTTKLDSPMDTEESVQNDYFNIHWGILTNKEMYSKIMSPLDKNDLTQMNDEYTEEKGSTHNYFDVISQLDEFQKGKDAKTLVAISSLAVRVNSMLQDKNVRLGTYVPVGKGRVEERETSIKVHYNGEDLHLSSMSGYGQGLFKGDLRTKHDNLTIIQNAAVDYAKKKAFDNLNINTYTCSALFALHTLETVEKNGPGKIVNLDFSTALTTQSIMWKFSQMMAQGNDSISKNAVSNASLQETVIKQLKEELISQYEKATGKKEGLLDDVKKFVISIDNLNHTYHDVNDVVKQYAVLSLFERLLTYGDRLSVLQKTLNQSTNGAGPNLVYAMQQQENFKKIPEKNMGKVFLNEEDLIRGTEQGNLFTTIMDVTNTVSNTIFPTALYREMKNLLNETGKDISDIPLNTQINVIRAFRAMTYTSTSTFGTDPMAERQRLLVGSKAQESLAKRVVAMKILMPGNYFLERLTTNINIAGNGPDEVGYENAKTIRFDDEKNISAFMKLLRSEDPSVKAFALDLIRYSYLLKSQNSPTSFITKIPSSFFIATAFAKDMRDAMENAYSRFRSGIFQDQFFQHNPREAIEVQSDIFGPWSINGQDFPEEFIAPNDYPEDKLDRLIIREDSGVLRYVRYVHFKSLSEGKTILYKLIGESRALTNPMYQRVDTLGNKEMDEYDATATGTARSVFKENRAAKEFNDNVGVFQALNNQVNYMIAESSDPNNAAADWGIPDVGSTIDLNRGLQGVAEDKSLPEYFRTMAQLLTESSQTAETDAAIHTIVGPEFNIPKFTIEVNELVDGIENAAGLYSMTTNKMEIKKIGNKRLIAETFLHETIHYRTNALAAVFGYVQDHTFEGNTKMLELYKRVTKIHRENNPEVTAMFHRLDTIRYQALLVFKSQMEARGIDYEAMLKRVEKLNIKEREEKLLYGLHNMDEFLTHIMTNREVMQFLNSIESSEGKGFVAKIWDLISDILIHLSKFINMDINEKALLKEAFMITMKLSNLNITDRYDIELNGEKMVPTTLPTETENTANAMKDRIENGYGQQTDIDNKFTHWMVNVSHHNVVPSAKTKHGVLVQTVIDQLKKQIREVNKGMSTIPKNEIERERYINALHIRNEMQTDLEELERISDISNIEELGLKQLEWVDGILKKSKPNINETILATNILQMWNDLSNTIYSTDKLQSLSETYRKVVGGLTEKAEDLRFRLLKFGSKAIKELGNSRGIKLTSDDLNKNLKGPMEWKKLMVALSRDINPAIQLMTSVGQEAANNSDEEVRRHTIRLGKLTDMIKAIPGTPESVWNKFIQSSPDGKDWGFVQQIKADWYDSNRNSMSVLRARLYKINTTIDSKLSDHSDSKTLTYSKFWNDMFKKNVVVDTRKLLDLSTGERVNTPEAEAEYQRLLKEVGSKQLVDDAISKSVHQFKKYLEHEVQKLAELDAVELTDEEKNNIQLSEESKVGMNEYEIEAETLRLQEDALDKKRAGYKKSWINKNSPAAFINTSEASNVRQSLNHTLTFLPEFLPKESSKLMDESYKEIQDNEKLKAIYDEIKDMLDTFKSYFPPDVTAKLAGNFLPVVTLHEISSFFKTLKGLNKSKAGQMMLKQIAVTQSEIDRQKKDEIPIDFINRYGQSSENLSRDLPKILEMFGNMAIHYKNMRPAQEVIEAIEIMVHNTTKNPNTADGANTKRLEQMIKFYKDKLVFKKAKDLELVSKNAIYSLNPMASARIERRVSAIKKRMKVLTDNALNDPEFKLRRTASELADPKSTPTEMEKLEEEASTYAEKARYLAGSKTGDFIIGIAQLKALAFNPFSAVNNLTFGVISAFIHAYGRADYTPADLRWGFMKMRWAIAKSWMFNTRSPGEAGKIRNITDRAGLITEVVDTMYGKSNLHTHTNYWQKLADPMGLQRSGDYLHKGAMLLAMMRALKVKVMENGVEKEINLYDAFNDDGEWNSEKYGERREWSSEDIDEQKSWNKFRDKARKVAMIVHGNQDKNSPLLQKYWILGRLLGQFRLAWIGEGINSRIGKSYHDAQLDREVKGRYVTLQEFGSLESLKILFSQAMSIVTKNDAFAGRENKKGEAITPVDIENMRKNLAEISYLLLMLGAYMLVSIAGPDEEEKRRRKAAGLDNKKNQMILNMITRSYQDLALYTSPAVFDQVTGNLIPSMSVINDARAAIWSVLALPFDDSKDAGSKTVSKITKAIPGANLINKYKYMATGNLRTAQR